MNDRKKELEKFKEDKVSAREELFNKAVQVLKDLDPVAIHQFGSGSDGYRDEFSDIDLFTTVKDDSYQKVLNNRENIYGQIAPLLLINGAYYEDKNTGRSYYHELMLYEVNGHIIHLDGYFFPESEVILPTKSILIYGSDDFPKKDDVLIGTAVYTDKSLAKQLKGLHAMIFISVKALVRYWDEDFLIWVKGIFVDYFKQKDGSVPESPTSIDFELVFSMLEQLKTEGDQKQQYLNEKIYSYAKKVSTLYKNG